MFPGVKGLNGPQASAAPVDLTQKGGWLKPKAWTAPLADMLDF